jgi:ParB family chromosome partitioning protein
MKLQNIKVSACFESETNPRGTDFEDAAFSELVASVKEKGVLVPVLARPKAKAGKQFEIIAGNRRFRAAQKAGLAEIPAQVEEMSDDEAQEAQIVENLQRADVHPLEEGEAYRKLIEDGGRKVSDIAVKVGKSESYVRQRLFLTNLSEKSGKLYRKGKIADAAVLLIARLSVKNQDVLVNDILYDLRPGNYDVSDLKQYIQLHFSNALSNQPWLKSAEIAKVVGPCEECPPNRAALFGEIKAGQCTDLKCWTRKMKAYLAWVIKENPDVLLVSSRYGDTGAKNVLSKSQYEIVGKKACDYVAKGLVAEGDGLGTIISICADKACKEHHDVKSEYAPSDKEQAKRKKERQKKTAERAKFDADILKALENVKWPLSEKQLDVLLELSFRRNSTAYQIPIVKRHGLEAIKKTSNGYTQRDYETPLRKLVKDGGKEAKLRLVFEFLLPDWNPYGSNPNKEAKSL